MRKIFSLTIYAGLILLFSFRSSNPTEEKLIGTWVPLGTDTYLRTDTFKQDKGGMIFKKNGDFIIRLDATHCGTMPITYANFSGTWTPMKDSIINVGYNFAGDMAQERMRILSIGADTLKVKMLYERFPGR